MASSLADMSSEYDSIKSTAYQRQVAPYWCLHSNVFRLLPECL